MIIKAFNAVFFALCFCFVLIAVAFKSVLKNKTKRQKEVFLSVFYFLMLVYFIYYKYQLSMDYEYSLIQSESGAGSFSWWTELPFNLCNISLIIAPIALLADSRRLQSFVFFVSPFGALMALLMPTAGFAGYSLFLPRVAGFYITHFAVLFSFIYLYILKIYRPKYSDVLPAYFTLLLISVVVFIINVFIRRTGLSAFANYFFLMNPQGNPALGFFYNLIPVPMLYIVVMSLPVLIPYMYLVAFIFSKVSEELSKLPS